ncbi:MAG: hypothetical protein ACXWW8_04775 [Solirubrobacterales bacterium]
MDLRLASGIRAALLALLPALLLLAAPPVPARAQGALSVIAPVTQKRAEQLAARDPNVARTRRAHPDLAPVSERTGTDWQVGFVSAGDELVQVIVDGRTGSVKETWSGEQVAWRMARGYPGAFGRKLNAPYVWLPLCAIFVLGLLDWRRPFRLAHLDLLVIVAGLGVSHFFFNRGEIGLSVPLAYPALAYLLARTLWLAFRGGPGLRPSAPATWLAVATLFLLGFRVGLNVADSNVIDVGYSGVVGADKIVDGDPIYGDWPANNQRGDTYSPVAYYAYVPFEQAFPWSGEWDDLPAAHAAAIFFDLATVAGLFALGRRLRPGEAGRQLGIVLAFAWAACPYTAFVLESNTNDSLVAALLVGALLLLSSAPGRGAMLALASATKFAPLALAPLFATYVPGRAEGKIPTLKDRLPTIALFGAAFVATTALLMAQTLIDPGLATFWERTVGFQAGRDSPFSIWGQTSLGPLHAIAEVLVAGLALLIAFLPRRRDLVTVAALGAAVMIALQLVVDHWFYLYVPWFLPFLFVALTGRPGDPAGEAQPAKL